MKNRLTATLSALGGISFFCHDRLGWEGEGYSDERVKTALVNLTSAPGLIHNAPWIRTQISDAGESGLPQSFFDEDRKLIGRNPVCVGWKGVVARLAAAGWYRGDDGRERKRLASNAISAIEEGLGWTKGTPERLTLIRRAGPFVAELGKQLRDAGLKGIGLELLKGGAR